MPAILLGAVKFLGANLQSVLITGVLVVLWLLWNDYQSAKDTVTALNTEVSLLRKEAEERDALRAIDFAAIRTVAAHTQATAERLASNVAAIRKAASHDPTVTCALPPSLGLALDQLRARAAGGGKDGGPDPAR